MHMGLEPSWRTVFGVAELAKEAVAVNTRIPSSTLRVFVIVFLSLVTGFLEFFDYVERGHKIGIDFRVKGVRMPEKYGTKVCRFEPKSYPSFGIGTAEIFLLSWGLRGKIEAVQAAHKLLKIQLVEGKMNHAG